MPVFVDRHKEVVHDMTNSPGMQCTKIIGNTNTQYFCNLKVARGTGLESCQTRSNAIVLYNTLSEICIEEVQNVKFGEEL